MNQLRRRIPTVIAMLTLLACGGSTGGDAGGAAGAGAQGGTAGTGGSGGSGAVTGGSGGTTNTGGSSAGGSSGAAGLGGSVGVGGAGPAGGSGGVGGTGGGPAGAGGSGGSDGGMPPPSVLITVAKAPSPKVDVLFMIDNSSSMATKQSTLAEAVPTLINRLIEPMCVDATTGRPTAASVNGVCPPGSVLEFAPIRDLHLGIITSSLGNHGASGVCEDNIDNMVGRTDPHNNDQAHLVSRGVGGSNVPTFMSKGFLAYNPSVAGAASTAAAVATPFASMVQGVGQHGCGYEASLESIYRFLVDPDPFATIRIDTSIGGYGQALLNGTDSALLQSRADFLRPDSLVLIVLMSDENDCSISDGGQGFYPLIPPLQGKSALQHGTSACLTNPNDQCCFNCGQQSAPAGCPDPGSDPECAKGVYTTAEDPQNLRCFNQKKKYGVDFLYPVQRYIDGLSKPMIFNRKNQMVQNPLFANSARTNSRVILQGIVGVPWQDIARSPTDLTLGYRTAKELLADGVWANIVGTPLEPSGPIAPIDSHMVESILPRSGLPGPSAAPSADPISGHEWDPSKDPTSPNADLQYACVFPLHPTKTCTGASDCDCFGSTPNLSAISSPLCQDLQTGAFSTTQTREKAFPSTRQLQVLQGLGDQAVVSSICTTDATDATRADYGYTPAMEALLRTVRDKVGGCFPAALQVNPTTQQVACSVIEVFNSPQCMCDTEPGRRTAPDSILTDEIKALGSCRCEISQLSGDAQTACRTDLAGVPMSDGWCYVDPAQTDVKSCSALGACVGNEQRIIRFLNANSEPRAGSANFIRCEAGAVITAPPPICPSN